MDFNPDDAQQYLEGVEYPASKEDVVTAAENNDAPDNMTQMLAGLSRPRFDSLEDVLADLRASPRST